MFLNLKKILIVDDSVFFREFFTSAIRGLGIEILQAKDGAEAISVIEKTEVDMVITDFEMPRLTGIGLLNWCRRHELYFPVVFTTAREDLFPAEKIALGDCCATLLRKPVNLKILYAALDAAEKFDHHTHCMHSNFHQSHENLIEAEFSHDKR